MKPLSVQQRKETIAWLASSLATAPTSVRSDLTVVIKQLTTATLKHKDFNSHSRQLARALGLIPSSERRRSQKSPSPAERKSGIKPKTARERLEQQIERRKARSARNAKSEVKDLAKTRRLEEKLKSMVDNEDRWPGLTVDTPVEDIELSPEEQAESEAISESFLKNLDCGESADASLQAPREALMSGSVVSLAEDSFYIDVDLPQGVGEERVVKTLTQTRNRYDISMTVTRLQLEVEKKVVVNADGTRRVYSATTSKFGPPRFAVTWSALATLAVMVGQFAMPFNRLATMLSTSFKRFTSGSLSRMAHYVAMRFLPIYLELSEQLADSAILAGDDTSCRVVEVSSYFSQQRAKGERQPPPWASYRTTGGAEETHAFVTRMKAELLALRSDGDRAAKGTPLGEPSLSLLIGRELDFESTRRDGRGPKEALNTTVITGRSDDDDPLSMIVFYRSHIGGLGDLIEMLLRKRRPSARTLVQQGDLSTTNLVSDPELLCRFAITQVGCGAHARRPFALYEDQDRVRVPYILQLFKSLAMHEDCLDEVGRNRDNVLAVRGVDSRRLWERIREAAQRLAKVWTKATPLGTGARYILKHYEKLTAYLSDPRIEATNNLRERLLRTEKLIEKSSLFRRTIEGRAVLDVLRTMMQTAMAAGVPVQDYLVDVMRQDADDIAAHPENYTPHAWLARRESS